MSPSTDGPQALQPDEHPREPELDSTYAESPGQEGEQGGHFASFIDAVQSWRNDLKVPNLHHLPPEERKGGQTELHGDDRNAQAMLLQFLAEFEAASAEHAARTETKFLRSLEALEGRVARLKNEASENRTVLDSVTARLGALARQQHESFQVTSQLASRLDDHVLPSIRKLDAQIVPALKQLENRTGDLQHESAEGRRSVGDMAALFSKGLKELTVAERSSAEEIEKSVDQTRQMRSELSSKTQAIHSTVNGRLDSLEKKVDANIRTSLSHWERLIEALELLEHKFSSIMRSIDESKAQNQISTKRSDDRILRALEMLEGAIVQLDRGERSSIRPMPQLPRQGDGTRVAGAPDLTAGIREERLVALMLDKDPGGAGIEQAP